MAIRSRRYSTLAALMVFVVSLLAATTAHAEEPPLRWYVNGNLLTGEETASVYSVGSSQFEVNFGGTPVVLNMVSIEPVGLRFSNEFSEARASGALLFRGVSVVKPSNCKTAPNIETKALSFTVEHVGEQAYLIAKPSAGEETGLLQLSLTGEKCALKSTLIMKGHIRGQFQTAPGLMQNIQRVSFAPAYMPYGSLHVGTANTSFTSLMDFSLKSGQEFGLK